ncbi:uncharacterized protein LOC117642403 isoform X2 [Thrips palmi]|uniref:Uncharacterized protein LOC117642403 isoform X2 n=1 Tax=Thrips palmi TaxID=161013 RepID=A0A6P8YII7_THRPL|nr:uncharacterized protein LOC117642403 isoform X2 [Thrips palmi]
MANISVLLQVENRSIVLDLEDNLYFTLDKSFKDYCKSDCALANRLKVYAPIYKAKNPLFGNNVTELIRHLPLVDKQEVFVEWCSLQVQENTPGTSRESGQVPARFAPNAADTLSSYSVTIDFKEIQKYYPDGKWDMLTDTEKLNEKARLEKHNLIVSMGMTNAVFTAVGPKPSTNKTQSPAKPSGSRKGKKKTQTQNGADMVLVPPSRKSSRKRAIPTIVQDDGLEDADDPLCSKEQEQSTSIGATKPSDLPASDKLIESHVVEDEEDEFFFQLPQNESTDKTDLNEDVNEAEALEEPGTSNKDQDKENVDPTQKPKRRKRVQLPREFGKYITEFNAMPTNISEELAKAIQCNKYSVTAFLTLTKEHIKSKIGEARYPSSYEYDLVCKALIKKFPNLADTDNPQEFDELKTKIRKSISGENYRKNKAEAKRDSQANESITFNTGSGASSSQSAVTLSVCPGASSSQVVNEVDIYIQELKAGVASRNRQLFLVRTTLSKRQESMTANMDLPMLEVFIKEFPHYMDSEMLLYEYSLVVNKLSCGKVKSISDLQENAKKLLSLLELHLNNPNQIDAINFLQNKLVPQKYKKENLISLFTFRHIHEIQGDIGILGTTQQFHSPCVLVLVDDGDTGKLKIVQSLLKMNRGTISIMGPTTTKTVMLQVMAPYFLFGLKYPPAYESILRIFERTIHGFFCAETQKTRAKKEYKEFVNEFKA